MVENFKIIQGYPNYEIGDAGSVYSLVNKRFLRVTVCRRGRRQVNLSMNGKVCQKRTHRLVAEHFIGPPPFPNACVRHLNDDVSDNRKDNLAWGSHQDNMNDKIRNGKSGKGSDNGNARLTDDDVRAIRSSTKSRADLSREYGIGAAQVSRIIIGTRWGHIT